MPAHYLCSFRPLAANAAGRAAARAFGLPPFVDGSCRREPDLEAARPSITTLCRGTKFAPRLHPGDRVAYVTGQATFDGAPGWALVALLRLAERFPSHEAAAAWYRANGHTLPSNCLMPGNSPELFTRTNRHPPKEVLSRVSVEADPERAVRLWDATYQRRARECGVFLACDPEWVELWRPPVLRREDLLRIFGRVPGTQNPPTISAAEYAALRRFASSGDLLNQREQTAAESVP